MEIVDLNERTGLALKANLKPIGSLEGTDDILTFVFLCTRRSDAACSKPVERWKVLEEVHCRSKVKNGSLLRVGDAIGAECAIEGDKDRLNI